MNSELKSHLQKYRDDKSLDVNAWIKNKTNKLNEYMRQHGLKGCVVGCSGGIDSAVTFALCMEAKKKDNSPIEKVVPILMPMDPLTSSTYNRAVELCEMHNVTPLVDPIGLQATRMKESSTDQFGRWLTAEGGSGNSFQVHDFAYGQLQSYLRTPHLYFTAQMLSQEGFPAVVMGTGNKDEDGYLAYFCKAGDGVVDVQLINDLHKSEVFKVASKLLVPESIQSAPPTADLWHGQTDEEELGVTYDFVELFTGYYLNLSSEQQKTFIDSISEEAKIEFIKDMNTCERVHQRNKHKLTGIVNL